MEKPKILAIIPARGGSKGIKNKNLSVLGGKPLIQYTIEAALQSKLISRIVLSSDDDKIIRFSSQFDLVEIPVKRPESLAADNTPMLDVLFHVCTFLEKNEGYKPGYIILLQPTSPLRTHFHIDEALEQLIKSEADSIVSVVGVPHQYNPYSVMAMVSDGTLKPFMEFDERNNLRQLKPKFYARNGAAIYAFTYNCLMNKKSIYGDKILPYLMKEEESIDIDNQFDLDIAEFLLKGR
jgi:CMP-N-acetylneuraminic acid synthetase